LAGACEAYAKLFVRLLPIVNRGNGWHMLIAADDCQGFAFGQASAYLIGEFGRIQASASWPSFGLVCWLISHELVYSPRLSPSTFAMLRTVSLIGLSPLFLRWSKCRV